VHRRARVLGCIISMRFMDAVKNDSGKGNRHGFLRPRAKQSNHPSSFLQISYYVCAYTIHGYCHPDRTFLIWTSHTPAQKCTPRGWPTRNFLIFTGAHTQYAYISWYTTVHNIITDCAITTSWRARFGAKVFLSLILRPLPVRLFSCGRKPLKGLQSGRFAAQ